MLRAMFRLSGYIMTLLMSLRGQDAVHMMANSGWSFHLFAKPAVNIARLYRVRVIMNYRGGNARKFFDHSWKFIKGTLSKVDTIVVPSGFLQCVFSDYNFSTEVVPNIIDLQRFKYQPPRLNKERLHLIVTRNLEPIYDNATAIRAFGKVLISYPNAILTVAGEGPQLSMLKSLTKELSIADKVTFVGRLGREQMAELYTDADIMINPSTVDNMPNSILEALASGVLVVSTNVGGIPFMVQDEVDAMLVEKGNDQAMCDAIKHLISNPELATSIAERGLENAKRYTAQQVLPKLEKLYVGSN
ncbi:hypothetical protein GCM10009092_37290 [Bowmanella denitrificans]|uniref:Glycosyl transferase family 1 domain-containing protein n=1 Tax=Bowmanella denitrificans TaxID=366582 RepID=A0ABN0XPJ8_9ALTE